MANLDDKANDLTWRQKLQIAECQNSGIYALRSESIVLCAYVRGDSCEYSRKIKTDYGIETVCTKFEPLEDEW